MIYNFNIGIGWASSGVEYAQAYRAKMLRNIGAEAKFIFTDMFQTDNIERMTKNIGFLDSEVIWLYSYFTDFKISPVTYTAKQLVKSFPTKEFTFTRDGKKGRYDFGKGDFCTAYFTDESSELVIRAEHVSKGLLIRQDFFTYGRLYSEYFAPLDNKVHLYQRRFFNRDGSVAYEEINDDGDVMYRFPDRVLFSKEELIAYFVQCLAPTKDDIIILDRTTDQGQSIIMNAGEAKIGVVIHADHFSEGNTGDRNILWNNYYEYTFDMYKHIDFYISSTEEQSKLCAEHFKKYIGASPSFVTVPVGGLAELKHPAGERKPFSILTASRLAPEKHVDWTVKAVAMAREKLPELTFDIYGKGGEEQKIKELISSLKAESYIHLMGQQDLTEVYQNYELYLAASTSEGFGLTLMESVGGGTPIIGFNVRYGNPTFIDEGENGYLIDINDKMSESEKIRLLADRIVRYFTEADKDAFHKHSYEVAERYLTGEVEKKWQQLLG